MNDSSQHDGLSLPGYTLSTRLGAGGYGEVWLAQAPGGLTKAVKFIYGSFHEKRAEHELRALQRIKDLRHPFLVSLERIEVVDGRLVIVTELADSSLKDRFDQCQREGLLGVPREELLGYLHDAADALDFLSEKHSLQHLDVKPENLLLVAGHVKVADFGLVKDVGQSQASLVGGLTPLYSAPEVFQGNPSSCSDQYSLAVLYQEMLTGVLPFTGVTAAELTLQHLHDEPDLSPLPTADRYVLSRALSKDPLQRFASCSELIEALLKAENGQGGDWAASAEATGESARRFEPVLPERRGTHRPGPVTEFFDEQIEAPRRELSPSMLLDWEPPLESPPRCLPAVELSIENLAAQPTLIIGIGGMAGSVLKQLRARLAKQFGDEPLPAVQMLLLDSDPKAIVQALQGPPRTALKAEETLALPLRRPQEYREQSAKLMRWLSRRWLYNIPKSLRTEGLRPLGRLAFADHARQVVQRIRMSLAQATDAESVRASAERAGLPFGRSGALGARVYLVASISGGTGSGMSLDVGYAVRTALDKAGVADAQIIGVLLHSAGHDPRQCDLSRVNAYAWLTEYNHFHGPGGAFPGDESCGLPALPAGKRAFDSAYLVDLGAGLDAGALEAATQSVAEYLYLDALTPAQAFFSECRNSNEQGTAAPLRTFTLQKIAAATDDSVERAASALSREVVLRWAGNEGQASATGAPSAHDTNQLVQGAATLVSQLQLKLEGLASNARGLIEGQFGGDQQGFVDNLMTLSREDGNAAGPAEMVRIVDCLFASPTEEEDGAFVLQRPLEAIVSPLTMKLAGDLARWVLHKLDDRQERLAGAQRAAQWLVDHLTRVETDGARLSSALAKQVAACADELRRANIPASAATQADWDRAIGYFRMRVDLQAVIASSLITRRLLGELKSVGDTVAEFGRHLKHVASALPRVEQAPRGADPLAMAVATNLAALTDAVDHQLRDGFINLHGGLFQTIMGNSRIRGQMLATLGQFARAAVEQLATRPDVLQSTVATTGTADYAAGGAESQRGAPPELLAHGGLYRALAVVPDQLASDTVKLIARRIGGEASALTGIGHDIVLCQEGWDLPLPAVAVDLIQRRRDYADFAARVASRGDVAWTPLTAAAASFSAVSCDNAFADAMPTVTQVL